MYFVLSEIINVVVLLEQIWKQDVILDKEIVRLNVSMAFIKIPLYINYR